MNTIIPYNKTANAKENIKAGKVISSFDFIIFKTTRMLRIKKYHIAGYIKKDEKCASSNNMGLRRQPAKTRMSIIGH